MQHINQTISQRLDALETERKRRLANRNHSANKPAASSIEETVSKTTTSSIELPAAIDDLIDNKMYRNKFKAYVRRGYLKELMELTDMAASKDKPSHWFATVTAKAEWERTLKFLTKAREIARTVTEVVKRLPVPTDSMKVVYKACWHVGGKALRLAVQAAETGRADTFKYFAWLVWKTEDKQATGATA